MKGGLTKRGSVDSDEGLGNNRKDSESRERQHFEREDVERMVNQGGLRLES